MSNQSFSRRRFLHGVSAGTAVLAAATMPVAKVLHAAEEESATKLRLGLVTYNWGKDWDLATVIDNCAKAGFSGVELRSTHKHGVEPSMNSSERAKVKAMFADSSVELVGLGSACEYHAVDPAVVKKNIEETKDFIRLCHDVGGSGVKVRPNGLPNEVPVEQTLRQIGKSLNEVAAYGADYGIQIRLEVHGRGTSQIPHIKTIMEIADHPNNVLCWNCNGEDLAGEGFAANYASVADRMGTVHIHDLRNANYPWPELFEQLKVCRAKGFTGWTLIEEGAVPQDVVGAMEENRVLWERLVG